MGRDEPDLLHNVATALTEEHPLVMLGLVSALLAVIAALSGDEMLRRRVDQEISSRADALPRWLTDLADTVPADRASEIVHVFRDGDNVVIGVRLPDGHEITAVVYIDHNMGTLVKDAFVVPGSVEELIEQMFAVTDDPDTQAHDLDLADARAWITETISSARSSPMPTIWPRPLSC